MTMEYFCPQHHIRYYDMGPVDGKPDMRCIECEINRADAAEAKLKKLERFVDAAFKAYPNLDLDAAQHLERHDGDTSA